MISDDDVVEALRSQMYGDATLTIHQWHLLGEILCRQAYTVEAGVRAWRVAGLQVDTGTLQDAVRACRGACWGGCRGRGGGRADPAGVLGESDLDRGW